MKIIDKYIIKNFLGTFFATEIVLLCVAIAIDISEKIDKFLKNDASVEEIVSYYGDFAIYYGNMYISLVVFLAAIIFTSRIASRSEIIAMHAAGISFKRLLMPYLFASIFLFAGALYINNFIIPKSNISRLAFEAKYIDRVSYSDDYAKNVQKQINDSTILYLGDWTISTASGTKFSLEQYKDNTLSKKLRADYLNYDKDCLTYKITNYFIRELQEDGSDKISSGFTLDTVFDFLPTDLKMEKRVQDKKTLPELEKLIEVEKKRGSLGINALLTERYKRIAMPFSIIILTIMAVSLSARKKRGGAGLNLAVGIVSMAAYIFMLRIFEVMASQGNEGSPLFWVWVPNLIFIGITIYLYKNAKK